MKHAGWIAGAVMLGSLVLMFEILRNIHGPGWAMMLAEGCICLVWLFIAWKVAGWADREIAKERERQSSD